MLRLGLTGSIATGKSTVLAVFERHGIPVFSADAAVHELYRGKAVGPIGAAFSGAVIDGVVDRRRLSELLVAEPDRLAALEAIVHPLVRAERARFLAEAEADGAPIVVFDIPLLFETGAEADLDAVAVVIAGEADLRRRALERPGMTAEKLETILARQLPQAEKRRRADYVIENTGSIRDLELEVEALIVRLSGAA
jgi:dephospho-CoA kinase